MFRGRFRSNRFEFWLNLIQRWTWGHCIKQEWVEWKKNLCKDGEDPATLSANDFIRQNRRRPAERRGGEWEREKLRATWGNRMKTKKQTREQIYGILSGHPLPERARVVEHVKKIRRKERKTNVCSNTAVQSCMSGPAEIPPHTGCLLNSSITCVVP